MIVPFAAGGTSDVIARVFHHLSAVAPHANEHASEVLGQLVTRDVEK